MRKKFKQLLLKTLETRKDVIIVTADLGYKMWDEIRDTYPDNFINVGASEQLMIGMCVGLAKQGYTPIAYSITPFLLYRPFEIIRNYISHENINVKLVGSGYRKDYSKDGFSHHDLTSRPIMKLLKIKSYYPKSPDNLEEIYSNWLDEKSPSFLSLRR